MKFQPGRTLTQIVQVVGSCNAFLLSIEVEISSLIECSSSLIIIYKISMWRKRIPPSIFAIEAWTYARKLSMLSPFFPPLEIWGLSSNYLSGSFYINPHFDQFQLMTTKFRSYNNQSLDNIFLWEPFLNPVIKLKFATVWSSGAFNFLISQSPTTPFYILFHQLQT